MGGHHYSNYIHGMTRWNTNMALGRHQSTPSTLKPKRHIMKQPSMVTSPQEKAQPFGSCQASMGRNRQDPMRLPEISITSANWAKTSPLSSCHYSTQSVIPEICAIPMHSEN